MKGEDVMGHKIITIGRQFGSGGHEIGDRLSKSLGIPLYDRNLVEMAADKMGLSEISVEEVDESVLNTFLSATAIRTMSILSPAMAFL